MEREEHPEASPPECVRRTFWLHAGSFGFMLFLFYVIILLLVGFEIAGLGFLFNSLFLNFLLCTCVACWALYHAAWLCSRVTADDQGLTVRRGVVTVRLDWSEIKTWTEVPQSSPWIPKVRVEDGVLRVPISAFRRQSDLRKVLMNRLGSSSVSWPLSAAKDQHMWDRGYYTAASTCQAASVLLHLSGVKLGESRNDNLLWFCGLSLGIAAGFLLNHLLIRGERQSVLFEETGFKLPQSGLRTADIIPYDRVEAFYRHEGKWNSPDVATIGFRDRSGQWREVEVPETVLNFEGLMEHLRAHVPQRSQRR